jgi:hypothetical protein
MTHSAVTLSAMPVVHAEGGDVAYLCTLDSPFGFRLVHWLAGLSRDHHRAVIRGHAVCGVYGLLVAPSPTPLAVPLRTGNLLIAKTPSHPPEGISTCRSSVALRGKPVD